MNPPPAPVPARPAAYRPLAAVLWMGGSVISFSVMAVAIREMGDRHDTFELLAWRSAIGLALITAGAAAFGRLRDIRANRLGRHLVRNLVHFTGQNLWFYAMMTVPMAQVFALEFTSPIWVVLLSPILFGERLTAARAGAAALSFVGVLIVTRPDFATMSAGTLAAIGCGFFFACTALITKSLTREEKTVSILFWLTSMQLVFGLLFAGIDGAITLPTLEGLPWLMVIGVTGVTAHLSVTSALSLAPASYVMPVDFIRLPLIAVVGAWAYAEAIDPWVIVGGAIIFAAVGSTLPSGRKPLPMPDQADTTAPNGTRRR